MIFWIRLFGWFHHLPICNAPFSVPRGWWTIHVGLIFLFLGGYNLFVYFVLQVLRVVIWFYYQFFENSCLNYLCYISGLFQNWSLRIINFGWYNSFSDWIWEFVFTYFLLKNKANNLIFFVIFEFIHPNTVLAWKWEAWDGYFQLFVVANILVIL